MKVHKLLKIAGPLFALVLTINTASASLLIEPHVAFNLNGSGEGTAGSTTHKYEYNGPQFGARVGYQGLGLMAGFDYTRSSYDFEDTFAGTGVTQSFNRNEMGIFAGYEFPILIRAWGAYYFSNTAKNDKGDEYTGNTKELGVGFTALPLLSVNLMYRMVTWDEINSSKLTDDINVNEIVLGVSLPLNL